MKRNVEGNSGNRKNNKLKRKVGRIRVTGKSVALKRKVGKEAEKNKRYTEESSGGIGKTENANWKMQKISFPSLLGFFAGVFFHFPKNPFLKYAAPPKIISRNF